MSFRIQIHGQQVDSTTAKKRGASLQNSSSAASSFEDNATITSALSQMSGDFAVRQDKVDSLRAQVKDGSYNVDPQAVAGSMAADTFWSAMVTTP
jgi:flagellar biosynthesis anti-sigma factor FlgM